MKEKIWRKGQNTQSTEEIIAQMFRMLLPAQILAVAVTSLTSIVNSIIIGNFLPAEAMVALGYSLPLTALVGALSGIAASGGRILCGRSLGRGDLKKINEIFTAALFFILLVGAILTLGGISFALPLAKLFGASGVHMESTAAYMRGYCFGIIPILMVPTLMVFLQMNNESVYSLISTFVLAGFALGGGLLNVKVFHGGILGMGISTAAAQFFTMIFLILKFFSPKITIRLDFKGINQKLLFALFNLGFSSAFLGILYSLRNTWLNQAAFRFGGSDAVSALAIVNSAAGPFDAVNVGVGTVVLMMGSVYVGMKDSHTVRKIITYAIKLGLLLALLKVLFIYLFSYPLVGIFGASGEFARHPVTLFRMYSWCMPLNIIALVFASVHQCIGRMKFVNLKSPFVCFLVPVAAAYVGGFLFGEKGVWICYAVAELVDIAIDIIVGWLKLKKRPKNMGDLFWMEQEFKEAERLSITMHTMEDVIGVSEKIIEFCKEHKIDDRRSNLCGLCLEEMAGNIIQHGFTKSKKKKLSADAFLVIYKGEIIIRLCDNAPKFDPSSKLGIYNPEDPCANIGIRMVSKIAKSMDYQVTFGMNVLSITM